MPPHFEIPRRVFFLIPSLKLLVFSNSLNFLIFLIGLIEDKGSHHSEQ